MGGGVASEPESMASIIYIGRLNQRSTYRQDFAKVHGLAFVGATFFYGDWDAAPPAQRKRQSNDK